MPLIAHLRELSCIPKVCLNKKAARTAIRTALKKLMFVVTKVQQSFGNWLQSHSWTHWATFTTPYTLTLPSARRLMNRFGEMRISPDKVLEMSLKGFFGRLSRLIVRKAIIPML